MVGVPLRVVGQKRFAHRIRRLHKAFAAPAMPSRLLGSTSRLVGNNRSREEAGGWAIPPAASFGGGALLSNFFARRELEFAMWTGALPIFGLFFRPKR